MCVKNDVISCSTLSFALGTIIGMFICQSGTESWFNIERIPMTAVSILIFYITQKLGRVFCKGSRCGYN
jgi:hypothetical protein